MSGIFSYIQILVKQINNPPPLCAKQRRGIIFNLFLYPMKLQGAARALKFSLPLRVKNNIISYKDTIAVIVCKSKAVWHGVPAVEVKQFHSIALIYNGIVSIHRYGYYIDKTVAATSARQTSREISQ